MKNIFRKLLVICALIITASFSVNFFSPQNTFAAPSSDDCRYVLGLTSWDCHTGFSNAKQTEDSIKAGIWIAVANVVTDIIVIAAYLVIGYVIYGGYLYIFSGGDPGKVANGKKTLTQAFIGLAIVMSAHAIMGAFRIALISNGNIGTCDLANNGAGCLDANGVNNMITNLIQWFIGVAGFAAAIFVVYGGIAYATSAGDSAKLQKAKQVILYALIGLVIVALAEVITAFISNMIREANENALTNETIISKEVHEIKIN